MNLQITEGDLLDQPVEVIVNAWNRNIIPWWLLLPQGVSGAIKRRAGTQPFREVARHGSIPIGGAVPLTLCRTPPLSRHHPRRRHQQHALAFVGILRPRIRPQRHAHRDRKSFQLVAFPLIGAGSGSGTLTAFRISSQASFPEFHIPARCASYGIQAARVD